MVAVTSRTAAAATTGLVPPCPAQDAGGPGLGVSLHRLVGQIALDFLRQLGRRGVALGGWFPQGLQADAFQARRDLGEDLARRGRCLLADLADDLRGLGGDERRPAGQDLVEDRPQAVDVGPLVDQVVAPLGLLGGHVCRRAQELTLHRPLRTGTRLAVGLAAGARTELERSLALPFELGLV